MTDLLALGASAAAVTASCAVLAQGRSRPALRRGVALLLLAAHLAVWWLFPGRAPLERFVIGVFLGVWPIVVNFAALELRLRGGPDSVRGYLFDYAFQCSDRLTRHLGLPREPVLRLLLRGALLLGAAVALVLLFRRLPPDRLNLWVWLYLKIAVVAVATQAVSDLMVGAGGGRVVPIMRFSWMSASYAEFWGRRYNLWMHGILRWFANEVLALRRRPRLALVAAFAVSGVVHELLSLMVLRRVTGWWSAFWAAQLALTFLTFRLPRVVPRAVAIAIFHATFLATSPLFFAVADRAFNFFGPVTPAPW